MPACLDHTRPALPLVSVVMPAFNSAAWIEETLASIAGQSIGQDRIELVIIDDGSTDATAAVAEHYLGQTSLHWRVVRQDNKGPSHARNVGLRCTRAPWIQFMDADDLVDPEKIEIQLAAVAAGDEKLAVVYSSWTKFGIVDSRWETPSQVAVPNLGDDPVTALLYGHNAIATGAQLYRRIWLERVGGWDEKHTNGEDHDLAFRVALSGGRFMAAKSHRPLFFYRRHGPTVTSLTSRSGQKNAEAWLRVAGYIEDQSRQRNELTLERAKRLASIYGGFARWLADYDWPEARRWIDRLFALDPDYRADWSKKFHLLSSVVGLKRAIWLASRARKFVPQREATPFLVNVPAPRFDTTTNRAATELPDERKQRQFGVAVP